MLPINVMYDSGITRTEEAAIIAGLDEVKRLLGGLEYTNFGSRSWGEGDFSSADWYVQHAHVVPRLDRFQLDAGSLLYLLQVEPWQEHEHIDVMFTSHDLAIMDEDDHYLNFVFGVAHDRYTVQSVARYRELPEFERYLAIKMVVQHELGHIFSMAADLSRLNTEDSLGPHCTNFGCVMRQGLSVPEWVQHALESHATGMVYCPQCLADAGVSVYDQARTQLELMQAC